MKALVYHGPHDKRWEERVMIDHSLKIFV